MWLEGSPESLLYLTQLNSKFPQQRNPLSREVCPRQLVIVSISELFEALLPDMKTRGFPHALEENLRNVISLRDLNMGAFLLLTGMCFLESLVTVKLW